jgi:copper(I)-binding protein
MQINRRQVVKSALLTVGAALVAAPAAARDTFYGTLAITNAWSAPTKPGETPGRVYMIIENKGIDSERLLSVRSAVARTASFIEDNASSGVIERVAYVEVRPRRPVTFRPGRVHVQLDGLTQQLKKGQTFPLTLVFAFAGPVEVQVDVDER